MCLNNLEKTPSGDTTQPLKMCGEYHQYQKNTIKLRKSTNNFLKQQEYKVKTINKSKSKKFQEKLRKTRKKQEKQV